MTSRLMQAYYCYSTGTTLPYSTPTGYNNNNYYNLTMNYPVTQACI
jgi:hypothetical protein